MDQDFMNGIEIPKTAAKLVVYMTFSDLQQLFRALEHDSSRFSLRNEVMFKLLATTGMRRSELVSLTWQQIELDKETIRINGKKERLLPLHPHLITHNTVRKCGRCINKVV